MLRSAETRLGGIPPSETQIGGCRGPRPALRGPSSIHVCTRLCWTRQLPHLVHQGQPTVRAGPALTQVGWSNLATEQDASLEGPPEPWGGTLGAAPWEGLGTTAELISLGLSDPSSPPSRDITFPPRPPKGHSKCTRPPQGWKGVPPRQITRPASTSFLTPDS